MPCVCKLGCAKKYCPCKRSGVVCTGECSCCEADRTCYNGHPSLQQPAHQPFVLQIIVQPVVMQADIVQQADIENQLQQPINIVHLIEP
jgi:hypothetical protein